MILRPPTDFRWVITGYLVSLISISIIFFKFDEPIVDFLVTCFIAWCGGFFFRQLLTEYRKRKGK